MVMFSKNWLSSLFSMIENGSVVVMHARLRCRQQRMRNVRDYYPPKDYHRVATEGQWRAAFHRASTQTETHMNQITPKQDYNACESSLFSHTHSQTHSRYYTY